MASSSKNPKPNPLSLPPPLKNLTATKNPNSTTTTAFNITPSQEDQFLSNSTHLTRQEVIKRRSHRLKQLAKCYKQHYWGLMEELRVQYREYVWKYGLSPFKEDEEERERERDCVKEELRDGIVEGSGETNNANGGNNNSNSNSNSNANLLCAFYGCKLKAMALTSFCQLHILSDAKQQLYKPCDYVIKSAQAGPITCGKPILRSIIPSLCNVHLQKAQKHVTRALKKAGLNVSSTNKLAPKLHVIVAEYVREIQGKRKAALKTARNKFVPKLECSS